MKYAKEDWDSIPWCYYLAVLSVLLPDFRGVPLFPPSSWPAAVLLYRLDFVITGSLSSRIAEPG